MPFGPQRFLWWLERLWGPNVRGAQTGLTRIIQLSLIFHSGYLRARARFFEPSDNKFSDRLHDAGVRFASFLRMVVDLNQRHFLHPGIVTVFRFQILTSYHRDSNVDCDIFIQSLASRSLCSVSDRQRSWSARLRSLTPRLGRLSIPGNTIEVSTNFLGALNQFHMPKRGKTFNSSHRIA